MVSKQKIPQHKLMAMGKKILPANKKPAAPKVIKKSPKGK